MSYSIPSVDQINRTPNGSYTAVSTFSGSGGGCLGLKLAGFDVRWASEFIPAAAEVYRMNHPNTILSTDDIREVAPDDICESIGTEEIDVLEGSPPCASFSLSGKLDKGWGEVQKYSDTEQRVDDLFWEYIRLIDGLRPKAFVAENTSGLVQGRSKGYFKSILRDMREVGYRVTASVIAAAYLGVPQHRRRLFFIGIRDDLRTDPPIPDPEDEIVTVAEAWEKPFEHEDYRELKPGTVIRRCYDQRRPSDGTSLGSVYRRLYGKTGAFNHVVLRYDRPSPTVTQVDQHYHPSEPRSLSIGELRRICAYPDDFALTGSMRKKWERIARAVPPLMMFKIAERITLMITRVLQGSNLNSTRLVPAR